jgi:protein tyrosine phosphatase (PTP) superfamily phosphohydrolase (DUF442 family)
MKNACGKISRLMLPVLGIVLASALACVSAHGMQVAASGAVQPGVSNGTGGDEKSAPANAPHAIAKITPVKGIPKFAEVSPQLLRGAQPSSEGLELLAKMGVGIIVNLKPGEHPEEEQEASRLGMRYVAIPWHCYHPNDAAMANFLAVLRENPDKKVFVHCELGTDRTGMSVAAYRMSAQGWSAEEAMKEMQAFGFSGSHHITCRGLAEYEQSFPGVFKSHPEFLNLRPVEPAAADER